MRTVFIFVFLLTYITSRSQTLTNRGIRYNLLENRHVLFNDKLINPALLTDSNKILIDISAFEKWLGFADAPKEYSVSAESFLKEINFAFGINANYGKQDIFQHRSLTGHIKRKFTFTPKSNIDFGLNIGIYQVRYEQKTINFMNGTQTSSKSDWFGSPIIDLGISYKYKIHALYLSYKNTKLKLDNSDSYYRLNGFIPGYRGIYNISKYISFIPEILGCFTSRESYGIVTGKLRYKHFFTGGILYNTQEYFGFLISGTILRTLKIGYYFEQVKNEHTRGSHFINIGLILKPYS